MDFLAHAWHSASGAFPAWLLALALKATVLLAIAGLVTTALRRASAATRHLVWLLALGACVALPFVHAVTPALPVVVPAGVTRTLGDVLPSRTEAATPAVTSSGEPDAGPGTATPATRFGGTGGDDFRTPAAPPAAAAATPAAPRRLPRPSLPQAGALLWLAGCAIVLGRRLLGAARIAWIARRTTVVAEPAWLVAITRHASRLGIRRAVALRRGADVAVPMTCGTFAPVVLLPHASSAWGARRRDLVLIHELAHVRRRDTVALLVAQLALALYWFHPLVWTAVRKLREESERACDDLVLHAGLKPSAYAEDLIDIARQAAHDDGLGAAALAMARRSQLEGRLLAILDPQQARGATGRVTRGVALLVAAPALVLLAAIAPRAGGVPPAAAQQLHAPAMAGDQDVPTGDMATADAAVVDGAGTTTAPAPDASHADGTTDAARPAAAEAVPTATSMIAGRTPATSVLSFGSGTRSSWNVTTNGSGPEVTTGQWVGPGFTASYKGRGKTTFTPDLRDIRTMEPGATLSLEERTGGGATHRAEITSRGGGIERSFYVDDVERPWNPDGQAWLSGFLVDIDRRTGAFVDERFPGLMAQGGADAVLAEIGRMSSDYGEGRYLKKLLASPLDDGTLRRIVVLAGRTIESDHELAEALAGVAAKNALASEATRRAFLTALDGIESDYEHARILKLLLEREDLSPDVTHDALASIARVQSDYERRCLLTALAEHEHVAQANQREYLRACRVIESSYERGVALKALLAHSRVGADLLPALLETSATFDSEYERANVLIAIAGLRSLDRAGRESVRNATRGLGDHERSRVLAALGASDPD